MSNKVLCVDDDPNILAAYQRNLRKQYAIDIALGGDEALTLLERQGPYAVVVADMQMPGMNGIHLPSRAWTGRPTPSGPCCRAALLCIPGFSATLMAAIRKRSENRNRLCHTNYLHFLTPRTRSSRTSTR